MEITKKKAKPTFARNVILRRYDMGLSAMRLAELADIPYPTLRDIEGGISGGRPATKEKIAKALGATIDELNTPRAPKPEARITSSKTEILGRLVELLPTLHESQLRFILNGIEQMHDPLIDALVEKHSKSKGKQTGGA